MPMKPLPRRGHRSNLEPSHVSVMLAEVLPAQGCSPAAVKRAQALWCEFLAHAGVMRLAGTAKPWCASLHYLVAPLSGVSLTQQATAMRYGISASMLSSRIKMIVLHTDQAALRASFSPPAIATRGHAQAPVRPVRARVTTDLLLATAHKLVPAVPRTVLNEEGWIAIFRQTQRLLSHLYGDKTHIDIWHYLAHVELNMLLAGYRLGRAAIADQFGKLFPRLGLQAAKGRDIRKFVYLHDIFGMQEPFALLKLESDDG